MNSLCSSWGSITSINQDRVSKITDIISLNHNGFALRTFTPALRWFPGRREMVYQGRNH